MALSPYIRERMERDGITQARLAGLLGTTQSEVSRRLHGRVNWQLSDLRIVAQEFGMPTFQLIQEAGYDHESEPDQIGA